MKLFLIDLPTLEFQFNLVYWKIAFFKNQNSLSFLLSQHSFLLPKPLNYDIIFFYQNWKHLHNFMKGMFWNISSSTLILPLNSSIRPFVWKAFDVLVYFKVAQPCSSDVWWIAKRFISVDAVVRTNKLSYCIDIDTRKLQSWNKPINIPVPKDINCMASWIKVQGRIVPPCWK